MKLGEAYVNVRADLKPYVKDLNAGLRATTAAFEKQLNKDLGRRYGKQISEGARESLVTGAKETAKKVEEELGKLGDSGGGAGSGRGLKNRLRKSTGDGVRLGFLDALGSGGELFTFVASALASALDDGISALPVQVKAALVAGVIAASPAILAALTALINSAVAVGVVGLGIGLASQLTPVADRFETFVEELRTRFASAAGPLIEPLLRGMRTFLVFVEQLIAPRLQALFADIAPGLESLLTSLSAVVSTLFTALFTRGVQLNRVLGALGDAIFIIGVAIGEALQLLLDSGTDGENAIRDLAAAVAVLVVGFAALLRFATEVYGRLRDIALLLSGDLSGFLASQIARDLEQTGEAAKGAGDDYSYLVKETDEQTKAARENARANEAARKALQDLTDEAFRSINAEIELAEAWDDITASIKENGKTLDINNEKGRENARKAEEYIQAVREAYRRRVEDGEITAEQAEAGIQKEIDKLGDLFGQTGKNRRAFDELFGSIQKLLLLELDPSGWTAFFNKVGVGIRTAIGLLNTLNNKQNQVQGAPGTGPGGGGSSRGYAEGTRITTPATVRVGEGYKPELIIPETKPRRAAQILANSGLAGILGGSTNVAVYIGNEQLDYRQFKVAEGVNRQAARTLSQTPRMV